MEQLIREILEREFEPNLIKKRKGRGGLILDYLETATVIRRLNEAFENDWNFKILEHGVDVEAKAVWVLGELKAGELIKQQFGAKDIYEKSTLGDNLKSAASDCLKKCATLFGVGLHLYEDELPGEAIEPTEVKPPADVKPKSNGNGKATGKQIGYIMGLTEKLHPGTRFEMVDWLKTLNIDINNISFEDASKVISTFEEKLGIAKRPK